MEVSAWHRHRNGADSLAAYMYSACVVAACYHGLGLAGSKVEGKPVKLLVGFFRDDDPKWAQPPKLETDATGNEYGQAEPLLTNAVAIEQMPKVNIHAYSLSAGRHTLRLPKGIIMVAGFTDSDIKPRDCGLNGPSGEVDWLFQK